MVAKKTYAVRFAGCAPNVADSQSRYRNIRIVVLDNGKVALVVGLYAENLYEDRTMADILITPPGPDDDWTDLGYDGAADADPDVVTLAVWTELDK
jgi:hypothetical protein